jgi:hypothetical protein
LCQPRRTSAASKRFGRQNEPSEKFKVSNEDQARLITERVARRLATESSAAAERASPTSGNGADPAVESRRARIINFISPEPPPRTQPSIGSQPEATIDIFELRPAAPQVAQSPWLAPFSSSFGTPPLSPQTPHSALRTSNLPNHPSEERFGVDEATVSELVEFFEAEKQCSVDPSGKPCDHCAMCSSRGF